MTLGELIGAQPAGQLIYRSPPSSSSFFCASLLLLILDLPARLAAAKACPCVGILALYTKRLTSDASGPPRVTRPPSALMAAELEPRVIISPRSRWLNRSSLFPSMLAAMLYAATCACAMAAGGGLVGWLG